MGNRVSKLFLSLFLAPASMIYRLGLFVDQRRKSRHSKALPARVISIGNLTVGGTGKTPLLIKLIGDCLQKSLAPAVLTRGYRGDGVSGNDETLLLREKFPSILVGVGSNRYACGMKIFEQHKPDIFILDDGFQHWALKRDVDIACIDALDPWGGGHLLPWGRLREPRSGLRRATIVAVTRCELVSEVQKQQLQADLLKFAPRENIFFIQSEFRLMDAELRAWNVRSVLKDKNVLAVSAIGHPAAFEKSLSMWAQAVAPCRFRDHHTYTENDRRAIQWLAEKNKAVIVTTEKDWVKLQPWPGAYILRQDFKLATEDQQRWEKLLF